MKIHIVQKGDTLWEIANNYGVDFEKVKELNPQLSSPDMIMPGMKIKIPSTSKPVKSDNTAVKKETQKPITKQPYKDTSPKPMPVVKEDDYKKPVKMQPKMPVKPEMPEQPKMPVQPQIQMPTSEQEINYYDYDTTINLEYDYYAPQKEKPKHMPQQMVMICPHCFKPSCPPPPMHHGYLPPMGKKDCGCGGPKQMPKYNPQPYGYMASESSPNMEMPMKHGMQNNNYSPYNTPASPQSMGMQQGFHPQQLPPQSHPHFANDSYNKMPYPTPPEFPGNQMFDFREDGDDSKGE
ncbi:SafA/ExsA family spore coat assembly protein [Virgibacillus doumboii]|uniref:SafA/ExsA family spore coat assembly protein n=1 Tax=Virgibacillus doumboii TaxID=2697503 RepID=UPI0013DFD444|nr:SafA/ExsA family spore coat assembly protein [Virgibacillus doumboii]